MIKMRLNKKAVSFMEYAIILGIISAVFISMNTYMKRGVQGRLKDMTDYFISNEQVVELNPWASSQQSDDTSNMSSSMGSGGVTGLALLNSRSITSRGEVHDGNSQFNNPFIPDNAGAIKPEVRVDESDSRIYNETEDLRREANQEADMSLLNNATE